jgi:hypothetical protein
VVPAADYRSRKAKADNAAVFDELIGHARTVRTLPFETSNRESCVAASEHLMSTVELLVAVWYGQPVDEHGGTGDVVRRCVESVHAGRIGENGRCDPHTECAPPRRVALGGPGRMRRRRMCWVGRGWSG